MPWPPKLNTEDLQFVAQTFGIQDINRDSSLTWFQDETMNEELIRALARANPSTIADAIEFEDVLVLRETFEKNPAIKELIKESAVYRMPLALLTQLDQAQELIYQQERDYAKEYGDDWNPFNNTMPHKSVYELSESSDYRDEWLLTTIMGVTNFLWPDVEHESCDTLRYSQEVCDASRTLATKILADTGQPFGGPVEVGTRFVIPQLRQAIYDRYLNP